MEVSSRADPAPASRLAGEETVLSSTRLKNSRFAVVAAVVGAVAVLSVDVHAYIDPGTGSLLYQTGLAVILGAAVVFRQVFARVGRLVADLFRTRPGDGESRTPR